MASDKFGWEREEQFDVKRLKLAESIIEARTAVLIILGGVAFLFLSFFIAPPLLFGPPAGLLTLIPLMALYGVLALVSSRLLGLKDEPDNPEDPTSTADTGRTSPRLERDTETEEES
jgi:hypothetical protein